MSGTLLAVFLTSILGSTHCVGMCGPFALLVAAKKTECSTQKNFLLLVLYHVGRLSSYVVLGAIAGFLGYSVIGLGGLIGVSSYIIQFSGLLLIAYGSILILQSIFYQNYYHWKVPVFWQTLVKKGYQSTARFPLYLKSYMIGFYSGFLPCGWLYAFMMLAVGSQSVLGGTSILLAFWAGTVPALTGFSIGVNKLSLWFKSKTQLISATICLLFGIMMLMGEQHACCQVQQYSKVVHQAGVDSQNQSHLKPIRKSCCQP